MKLLIVIIVFYIVAFSFLSIRNHELYQTFGWDLGFFDQLLWQASRGNLNFVSTIGDINLIGDHFQPLLYLIAPLYWAWDDVRIILIAQTIIVASAAIPIYLLAEKKLESQSAEHDLSFRVKSRNLAPPGAGRFVSLRWIPRLSVFARDDESKNFTKQLPRSNRILPLLISIGFLLFHGTQFTLTNEFHQSAFIPLFLSLGLYFLEIGKTKQGIGSLLLLLLVREENTILIAGIGFMYLVRVVIPRLTRNLTTSFRTRSGIYIDPSSSARMTRKVEESNTLKLGISLVVIGIVSFFLLVSWVIPQISSQGKYIHFGYGELGSTPTEVTINSLKDPMRTVQLFVSPKEKLIQVRNSLLSFGGLPLLSPSSLIPVVFHYAVRFIDTRNVHRWFDTNHYAVPLGVLLAFATIQALSVIARSPESVEGRRGNLALRMRLPSFFQSLIMAVRTSSIYYLLSTIFVFGVFGTNLLVHAPIFALTKSQLYFTPQWVKDADALVTLVPKDAAVAANNSLVPHLSHREKIYLLPDIRDADYIAIDLSDGPNKYAPWGYERMRKYVDELMVNEEWEIEKQFGKAVLLKKKN